MPSTLPSSPEDVGLEKLWPLRWQTLNPRDHRCPTCLKALLLFLKTLIWINKTTRYMGWLHEALTDHSATKLEGQDLREGCKTLKCIQIFMSYYAYQSVIPSPMFCTSVEENSVKSFAEYCQSVNCHTTEGFIGQIVRSKYARLERFHTVDRWLRYPNTRHATFYPHAILMISLVPLLW